LIIHAIIIAVDIFAMMVFVYVIRTLRYIASQRSLTFDDYWLAGIHCAVLLGGAAVMLLMW